MTGTELSYLLELPVNRTITLWETQKAINKAKMKKATGTDSIPNEALKNDMSVYLLQNLFHVCFENCIRPIEWTKAMINPIPKGKLKDLRIPLNTRGISLLSTIYKIYTGQLS